MEESLLLCKYTEDHIGVKPMAQFLPEYKYAQPQSLSIRARRPVVDCAENFLLS
jgi:hypothetical protein